ncbi:MAG: type I-F CRISPR-associated protein Csy2 [Burkholderiales bacterium]|nr:type I-F CRISPR-associated protein Csy2 [Burkholderiales bacterium]
MRNFILIPHLKLHNANAMSSPYTIGFPAMTAWLGAVHALQRKLQESNYSNITLDRVAISCHGFNLQTYRGRGDYVNSIIATANPLDKDGSRPAFIEEARCHLEVSILIECVNFDLEPELFSEFKEYLTLTVLKMKFASGDVLDVQPCEVFKCDEYAENNQDVKKILRKLMLGHVLVERRDLVQKAMIEEQKDALDAVLDYLKVSHIATEDEYDCVSWNSSRKESAWLVPIAVGFQGISELGTAKNQRDIRTPHRFAESVITLGEFIMPYRIKQLDDMLWQYHVDLDRNLYLCQNLKTVTSII